MTTPTHVFGYGAQDYATAHGYDSAVIMQGTTLNAQSGASGQSPETARHIVVTPGRYTGVDFYLGARAFVTLEGAPEQRPQLVGDGITIGKSRELTISNIEAQNCPIAIASYREDGPVKTVLRKLYQHSFTKSANGFVNPNGTTAYQQETFILESVFDACGDPGNTKHVQYIEGRPKSRFIIEDSIYYGARACSQVKTTCRQLEIRRTQFHTRSKINPGITAGSMIDVPACSVLIATDNLFEMWRNPVKDSDTLNNGLAVPAIHRRNRQKGINGSDIPAYPNVSWDPPVSKQTSMSSPGGGWSAGPETYVDDDFWLAVQQFHDSGSLNPYEFPAYVSRCVFRVAADSLPLAWLRDDGTRPCEEAWQFGPTRMLRAHTNFHERSITYHAMNTFEGAVRSPVMDDEAHIIDAEEGACHPRTLPQHYPRWREEQLTLPAWFKT